MRDFHSDVTSSDWIGTIRLFMKITCKGTPDAGSARECIDRLHYFASWGCEWRALD